MRTDPASGVLRTPSVVCRFSQAILTDRPRRPVHLTIPDYLAGLNGAFGALMAVRAREMTGAGQFIDIGLYEPIFRFYSRAHGPGHEECPAA